VTTLLDPVTAAEQWLATVRLDDTQVLFIVGLADGYVLDALDRKGWRGHVIAVEPDASAASECLDRKLVRTWQTAGRLTMLAGPDYSGLDKALAGVPLLTEKPVIAGNPAVTRAHREASVQAARAIARAWFGARANDEARKQNAGRYLQNTLRNADAIVREGDANALKGLFTGVPALVVGAGPSLDRNIADIAPHRDRVVIIAADTSLRPLLAAGIEPDIVVATDPTETNARHLNDLPPCPRTHLVAEGSVDAESLPHFAGRTLFFRIADHHPWPWLRQAGHDRGHLRAWGSVLTTVFDLALEMGCEPIVFAGADLAFTGGRPYARGTTYEEVWHRNEMWGQPLEECWSAAIAGWPETHEIGVTGQNVRTAPHLRSFRDWIAAEAAKATGRTIINGTGGGILVGAGIDQRSLAEVLSGRPALGSSVGSRVAEARRSSGARVAVPLGEPNAVTLAAWQAFSGKGEQVPFREVEPAPVAEGVIFDCVPGVDLVDAIETAWQGMSPASNRLVLRDQTGSPAGVSVRRALFAFLERHPEVTSRFGRFFEPHDDRSWIDRRPPSELFPGEDRDKWQDSHADVANRLTPLIVERLSPSSVLDMGSGAGHWLRALAANGVEDVTGVDSDLAGFMPARTYDVCLCLGIVQALPMTAAKAVIAACAAASDTVVFAAPAPAIGVPGFVSERAASFWAGVFADQGFAAHDELRPAIESRWGGYLTSYDLATVYRRVIPPGETMPAALRAALVGAASRVDDLVLQFLLTAKTVDWGRREPERRNQPRMAMSDLAIAPARMEAADAEDARCVRLRTAGGSLSLSTGAAITVMENGALVTGVVHDGAVTFRSSDRTDPRRNGRCYTIEVPAHVAWLEQQPLATILEHRL
jgi:SAM-dependent methyltransferase